MIIEIINTISPGRSRKKRQIRPTKEFKNIVTTKKYRYIDASSGDLNLYFLFK